MRTEQQRIISELERQHAGEPWHGPSRATVLDGITAAQAAWRPARDAHSIWAIVLHMRSWTREVTRRALGGAPGEPLDGDWPAVPTPPSEAAWAETKASLDAAHEELVATVRAMSEAQLTAKVAPTPGSPSGTGISHRAMLTSLAQHDIYHTGQVAMLKRLAAAR